MAELLTNWLSNEGRVLRLVRSGSGLRRKPVETWWIADHADEAYGLGYDSTLKALRVLVDRGLLSKPRRGYYLPTEEDR